MARFKLSSLLLAIVVLSVLMACGVTWWGRYQMYRIDSAPIAWERFTPEAVQRELDAGKDVIVVLNFDILSARAEESQSVDTPRIRRLVARGTVAPLRLRLSDDRTAQADRSLAVWKKYGKPLAPAVLIYRHERPTEEPWVLRAPFSEANVLEVLGR